MQKSTSGPLDTRVKLFRTALVDRSRLFREGIACLLQERAVYVVVSARTLSEAFELGPSERPELALLGVDRDTNLEESFTELERARAEFPGLRTVVLAQHPDGAVLSWAAASGVDALLSKDISGEILRRSLELVMLGQQLFPPVALERPPGPGTDTGAPAGPAPDGPASAISIRLDLPPEGEVLLSDREEQILRSLVAGASNKLIARELGITEGTVKVHVKSLFRKLGKSNRTQAAIWGRDRGGLLRNDVVARSAAGCIVNGASPLAHLG